MARVSKAECQKIIKLYNSICGEHQLWELWQDSMTIFACVISNSVDKRFFDEREQLYKSIVSKYSQQEITIFLKIFTEITLQLEENTEQDLLGDLYMQLNLNCHWNGQFFTPYVVCEAMAQCQVEFDIESLKPISVMDCACGGGALLIASANHIKHELSNTAYNWQYYVECYAQDLSSISAMMCYIQLSLIGISGKVKIGNSLLNPLTKSDDGADVWYTPMWFSDVWSVRRIINNL